MFYDNNYSILSKIINLLFAMKKLNLFFVMVFIYIMFSSLPVTAQEDTIRPYLLPVKGLCIKAPQPQHVDEFVQFIHDDLAAYGVNTLVLRVDYNYEYQSRPELRQKNPLTRNDVKKLVLACQKENIRLIPQINLLGHQSWASNLGKLLEVYPEFDETPHIEMPEEYEWPNEDGLYCKSYCPRHPLVHDVVFDLVDEIVEVFEADAFHAGMDEVFYIGNPKCPRCGGSDPARLFAEEVRRIHDHLEEQNCELWIWGDRLLDGKTTGLGMWQASMNNTYRAIDMIPQDVVINDWHYNRAVPTAVHFAMKGFDVISCPYRNPEVAVNQVEQQVTYRSTSPAPMNSRFKGMMQTVWTDFKSFYEVFQGEKEPKDSVNNSVRSFRELFERINEYQNKTKL